jgi:L-arabinose isomerase
MYRCRECDSTEVQEKFWVNINTFKVSDMVEDGKNESWCEDCEKLVEVYDDELTKLNDE